MSGVDPSRLAKRRQELVSLEQVASQHRASLGEYSLPLLDQMLSTVAGMCILAYGLYTVAPDTVARDWRLARAWLLQELDPRSKG